ncbi:ATP-binding protein [Streptomyces sp. NPDC088785]|uniref:ATP-binding protein n=1 Tax=Streptomyces sp. NPDC088785 TaxID=3365897 RepID=UPI0038019FD8
MDIQYGRENEGPIEAPGDAPAEARGRAREVLAGFTARTGLTLIPTMVSDVLLVVSELVTNAMLHAGGVTGFHCRVEDDVARVIVQDASTATPTLVARPAGTFLPGGYGWPTVQRLARAVTVEVLPGKGKRIIADVALA